MSGTGDMEHRARAHYRNGDLEVIDCEPCGYKHLWPLPTEAAVREIYERKFGGAVRSGFVKKKREDADHWQRVFERRLDKIDTLIKHDGQLRVLDVGCGVGDFLSFMKAHGWDVWGIEPSQAFHEELERRSVNIVPRLVEDITDSEWSDLGQFDVINMSQFLEHVRKPVQILEAVMGLLRPGGLLTLECPNDFNPFQMSAVDSQGLPMWWISPLHINYFDFQSLENLCRRVGCEPVARTTQFPLEMFLHFGDLYVEDPQLGREIHVKRMSFEDSLVRSGYSDTLSTFYDALAGQGLGRHATIYAQKAPSAQVTKGSEE